jgi:hypothetical protein
VAKNILGFMSISNLIDNTPGVIAKVGELSTWSRTYSKTKGEYFSATRPDFTLVSFSSTNDTTGADVTLTTAESSLAIEVFYQCYRYATTHPLPLDPEDFRNSVQAEMFEQIQELSFGELQVTSSVQLPAWVSFTAKGAVANTYHVWTADEYFKAEYPDYDITIVNPLPDLADFAGNWQQAVNKLADWPFNKLLAQAQVEKQGNPETYTLSFQYDFVNRVNPTQKIPVTWIALVYGESGNSEDAVKDAIIDKLVTETGYPETAWEPIFPELFKRTEFVMYPRWDRLSIPNVSNLTALYSPFTPAREAITKAVEWTSFYPQVFIEQNVNIFPVTYKSVSVVAVNGYNNMDDQKNLADLWKDYICVDTSSPDFERMQPLTKEWVHFMIRLVSEAETANYTSAISQGFRRVKRGNLTYLSGNFNKANYLVVLRKSLLEVV